MSTPPSPTPAQPAVLCPSLRGSLGGSDELAAVLTADCVGPATGIVAIPERCAGGAPGEAPTVAAAACWPNSLANASSELRARRRAPASPEVQIGGDLPIRLRSFVRAPEVTIAMDLIADFDLTGFVRSFAAFEGERQHLEREITFAQRKSAKRTDATAQRGGECVGLIVRVVGLNGNDMHEWRIGTGRIGVRDAVHHREASGNEPSSREWADAHEAGPSVIAALPSAITRDRPCSTWRAESALFGRQRW